MLFSGALATNFNKCWALKPEDTLKAPIFLVCMVQGYCDHRQSDPCHPREWEQMPGCETQHSLAQETGWMRCPELEISWESCEELGMLFLPWTERESRSQYLFLMHWQPLNLHLIHLLLFLGGSWRGQGTMLELCCWLERQPWMLCYHRVGMCWIWLCCLKWDRQWKIIRRNLAWWCKWDAVKINMKARPQTLHIYAITCLEDVAVIFKFWYLF